MQVFLFIVAILLFIGLVLIHEWGHYIAARRNGVEVEEYGLGFPPRAWGKKLKSGMILSLNWLPLGGFVKLKGEYDSDTKKGSFGAATLWGKTKIMLAGVTMNLIVGLVLLTVLALAGMPKLLDKDTIGEDQFTVKSDTKVVSQEVRTGTVQDNSPASKVGLSGKDVIVSIASGRDIKNTHTMTQLHDATSAFAGKNVLITYKHGNKTITKATNLRSVSDAVADLNKQAGLSASDKIISIEDTRLTTDNVKKINSPEDYYLAAQMYSGDNIKITYESNGQTKTKQASLDPEGFLGILDPVNIQIQRSTWSAPVVAVGFTVQLTKLTFVGLGHAFGGLGSTIAGLVTGNKEARQNGQTSASAQVGGPVAIVAVLWGSGSYGLSFILWIIAVLSLTLAIMNVLPIPALDGGRLAMILYSRWVLKKPLSKVAEERFTATGMAVLLGLIVLITIVDVRRFF
jgi:membrane-associated protease RseP (regulator of RpoE activity)